jgi:hypothetical protein
VQSIFDVGAPIPRAGCTEGRRQDRTDSEA